MEHRIERNPAFFLLQDSEGGTGLNAGTRCNLRGSFRQPFDASSKKEEKEKPFFLGMTSPALVESVCSIRGENENLATYCPSFTDRLRMRRKLQEQRIPRGR